MSAEPKGCADGSGVSSDASLRDEYPNEDWQECGDTRPHKAHPWSDVVCPGIDGASAARIRELREAVRLLREAGQRGSDGYPASPQRVDEHEKAALAVEEAIRRV